LAYPEPKQPVTPQNAAQVRQLVRWGKGLAEGLAYSPDGRRLAVASGLGVYLYDAESLAETRFISTEVIAMRVAFSPDGRLLASASSDNTVKLWDIQDRREIRTFSGHDSSVLSMAFSPDGRMLASAFYTTIKLWDAETGRELRTLSGHASCVNSLAFAPSGLTLASGSCDGTVRLWGVP
jgi:WD40 repeat protein